MGNVPEMMSGNQAFCVVKARTERIKGTNQIKEKEKKEAGRNLNFKSDNP